MKKITSAALIALLVLATGNVLASSPLSKETQQNKSITQVDAFFPRVEGSFVGDPMPVYADGLFNIFT